MRFILLLAATLVIVPSQTDAQEARRCQDSLAVDSPEGAMVLATLRRFGATDTSTVWRVCDMRDTYVSAVWAKPRNKGKDYGTRVVVLRKPPDGAVRVAFATPGLLDSDRPQMYVYGVDARAFAVADLGNEGSWGLATYEITSTAARELGHLDVGLLGSDGDPDMTAIAHARPSFHDGSWRVAFDTLVITHPGVQRNARSTPPRKLSFDYSRGGWRIAR